MLNVHPKGPVIFHCGRGPLGRRMRFFLQQCMKWPLVAWQTFSQITNDMNFGSERSDSTLSNFIMSTFHYFPFLFIILYPKFYSVIGLRISFFGFFVPLCSQWVLNGFPCVTKSARRYLASSLGGLVLGPLGLGTRR